MNFTLLGIGFESGGPIIEVMSIISEESVYSFFCLNISFSGIFLEVFGIVLLDTFED